MILTSIFYKVHIRLLALFLVLFQACAAGNASDADQADTILITPLDGSNTLYILNKDGNVIWKRKEESAVTNFQKWNIKGKTFYSYFLHDTNAYVAPIVKNIPGWYVVTDSALNPVKRLEPVRDTFKYADKKLALDCHEFILIDENHYISIIYYDKVVENIPDSLHPVSGLRVLVSAIQEVKDGKVVFQWESTDYPELYGTSIAENKYSDLSKPQDYLHVNSISIDTKDNNLILSCRNADQVIKIDRTDGHLIWRLGGKLNDFPMADSMHFLQQHDATFTDNGNTILLFDNGFEATRPYSRIVEFQLDEVNKKITSFKAFKLPGKFAPFAGSVQKYGNYYLVSGGVSSYIQEINYKTGEITFEKQLKGGTYRIWKY